MSADNPNLGFVFSLTSPPLPILHAGHADSGEVGQDVQDGPPAQLSGFVLKILWRKFEHPKVTRNFALLVGSPLWR